jgi:two-component system, sensor histidine kinase PdtaS
MKNLENPKGEIISFKNAAIVGLLIIIISVLFLFINGNGELNDLYTDIIMPIVGILSVFCLFYASKRSQIYGRRIFYAWILIAIGLLQYVVGDILWAYLEIGLHIQPFPSIADIFYLLYYLFLIIGIFFMIRPLDSPEKVFKTILDAMIVVISATLIFYNTILSVLVISHRETTWALSLSLYYIIRDFVIFLIVLNLTLRKVNKCGKNPLLLLVVAILVQLITDSIFSYLFLNGFYKSGNFIDIGWLIFYILMGLTGILQGNIATVDAENFASMDQKPMKYMIFSVPMIWITLAVFMLVWGYYNLSESNFYIIQIKVLIFFILLIIRRTITVNENWRLKLK